MKIRVSKQPFHPVPPERYKKDKAIASVQQKTHQGLDEFCGQPDCIAGLAAFDKDAEGRKKRGKTEVSQWF